MSGLEIFGAIAAALGLAQQVLKTISWVDDEVYKYKNAYKELRELRSYTLFTAAVLGDIETKGSRRAVRDALSSRENEKWAASLKSTVRACERLLEDVEGVLPEDMDTEKKKEKAADKIKASWKSKKTASFSDRFHKLNSDLKSLAACPPLIAETPPPSPPLPPPSQPWEQEEPLEFYCRAVADYTARNYTERSLRKGELLIRSGAFENGWAKVRKGDDGTGVLAAADQELKWVPAGYVSI